MKLADKLARDKERTEKLAALVTAQQILAVAKQDMKTARDAFVSASDEVADDFARDMHTEVNGYAKAVLAEAEAQRDYDSVRIKRTRKVAGA